MVTCRVGVQPIREQALIEVMLTPYFPIAHSNADAAADALWCTCFSTREVVLVPSRTSDSTS
jgi:hypothetical protein